MITSLPDPAKGVLYHVNNNSVVHVDDLLASSAANTVKFVPTTYACCDVTIFTYRARDSALQFSDIQYFYFIYCGQIFWFLVYFIIYFDGVYTPALCIHTSLQSIKRRLRLLILQWWPIVVRSHPLFSLLWITIYMIWKHS